MTFCRCHCSRCGSHFASLEAFDLHHEGSGATLVPCVFPEDAPLVEITGGTCAVDDPHRPDTDALVYTTVRAQGAARYFRRPRRPRDGAGRTQIGGSGVSDQRPEQPDHGVRPVPANILKRPLKLRPMRSIKDVGGKR